MRCPVHLSIGQEAIAVAICSELKQGDFVFSGHRSHAHYLAMGGSLKRLVEELYGNPEGCCGGRGGSMHLTDLAAGFIASTPIVGSSIPIAVGSALKKKIQNEEGIVVVFFGDGAMETGIVHECMNFAKLKNLNILFVCEDNGCSVYSPKEVRQPHDVSLCAQAESYGINSLCVENSSDIFQLQKAVSSILEPLRNNMGPQFIQIKTSRFVEHCGPSNDDILQYRDITEVEMAKSNDFTEIHKIDDLSKNKIIEEIDQIFRSAQGNTKNKRSYSPMEEYAINEHNLSLYNDGINVVRNATGSEAIKEAIFGCMEQDESGLVFGLGVPDPKGIFGTTIGLQERFGEQRVFDIPLSEHALTGIAIGCAISGLRPILIHQRLDFSLVSIDQIVNQAAKWYSMFNGQMNVPLVIRMIIGRGWGQGPQHSQSLHSWFGHIPGLKVVAPSSPYSAKGLLISSYNDNNPVLFIEHRWIHHYSEEVPEYNYELPIGKASLLKQGSDITVVGIGYMTIECLRAWSKLQIDGVYIEVIDLLSIRPLDIDTIINSVKKTKRILVVDHAFRQFGTASEIISRVVEIYGTQLKSNPQKITLKDTSMPSSPSLANNCYPDYVDIVNECYVMLGKNKRLAGNDQDMKDVPNTSFNGPF